MSTSVTGYPDKLRKQLKNYKEQEWPELAYGEWRYKGRLLRYPHILPADRYQLNILPGIRERFWEWFRTRKPKIKLHKYFHHLVSSQALCFNLFFPFLKEDGSAVDSRLLQALGIEEKGRFTGYFEKVLEPIEKTNFDFYLKSGSAHEIFFELKLSESEFGACDCRDVYRRRLNDIYERLLENLVDRSWLKEETFFKHYQILRNVSYLSRGPKTKLFFVFPKANECLKAAEDTIRKIAFNGLGDRVTILYLEELIERILNVTKDDPALQQHFQEFKKKYVFPQAA
jgi:hypothetical protein